MAPQAGPTPKPNNKKTKRIIHCEAQNINNLDFNQGLNKHPAHLHEIWTREFTIDKFISKPNNRVISKSVHHLEQDGYFNKL